MFVFLTHRKMVTVLLLFACSSAFIGEFHTTTLAAVPYSDDENEFIIGELENIIKDQRYRMRNNIQDEYPVPSNRISADNKQLFTYDMASNLPEINTGNQDIPFAVLPNDRRYYQPDFSDNLLAPPTPGVQRRYNKKERFKSHEVLTNFVYGSTGGYASSKVTTENSSTEVSAVDVPQATFMHMPFSGHSKFSQEDYYFFAKAAGVGLAVLVVLIISSIACYRMKKNNKAAADIEYPAYGITGPNKDISPTTGDRRLAQSAQMYHYQHQKQQIIAMESNNSVKESRCGSITDPDSDDDNEEGDYTVYECPGLAPAGEMEVKNPLFLDDNTPASPNATNSKENTTGNGVILTMPVPK